VKTLHSLIAVLRSAYSIVRQRVIFPLLCLGAGLVLIRPCTAESGSGIWTPTGSLNPGSAGTALSQSRQLSFEDRVAYQRAMEEVYWRHRIWPKERRDPKPALDAVMSRATIEKKVQDYLRNSELLAEEWQTPITSEQLQAEMERMAQHSKQPEVLRELFAALGNDPFAIAECLARPVLAQRLVSELKNEERVEITPVAWLNQPLRSWLAKSETQVPMTMAAVTANYTRPLKSDQPSECIDDSWMGTGTTNAPTGRYSHTAVWTGSEMIVWGGEPSTFNTGGRYNPRTDTWTATSTTNAPTGRFWFTAVWTGSEMIVWGGYDGSTLGDGGRYNPETDSWTATSTTNAPTRRSVPTAVWAGSEMIVWGGLDPLFNFLNTGGRYNPGTDSWTATTTTNAPTGRELHTAVWTGSEMIVWGGSNGSFLNSGGRYNPSSDSWTATANNNAPTARYQHTAVWTDSEMIVWGGSDGSDGLNSGGRYCAQAGSLTITLSAAKRKVGE
jgi:hypothetical protein